MAKKKNNNNDELENIFNRSNLPNKKQSIPDLVKEGNEIIDAEEKTPVTPPVKSTKNPYSTAHDIILKEWSSNPNMLWRAKEIQAMERGDYPKNQFYDEFVLEVSIRGDTLSNQ
jgi:hypothetical protein